MEQTSESDLVLDVGSKSGEAMSELSSWTVALDIEFQDTESDTVFVQGDGTNLPFESGTFDYVNVHHVLEHVDDKETLVGEVSRVLKSEGEAIVSFPNRLAPRAPHETPWWYSYLPRSLGEALAPVCLDEEQAEYFLNHEFMLTPPRGRKILNRYFHKVEYVAFEHKDRFESELRENLEDNWIRGFIFDISPVMSRLESTPVINSLIELFHFNAVYICQKQ